MDNYSNNYAEAAVTKKYEGTYKLKRNLLICAYVLGPLLLIILILAIGSLPLPPQLSFINAFYIWFIPLVPLFLSIVVPLTYKYVQIEYEYTVSSGRFIVTRIYGRKKRKEWLDLKISDMKSISPYRGQYKNEADNGNFDERYDAVSSMSSPDVYFATYTDADDRNCILFFEPTAKILNLMKFHNRATVVEKVSR